MLSIAWYEKIHIKKCLTTFYLSFRMASKLFANGVEFGEHHIKTRLAFNITDYSRTIRFVFFLLISKRENESKPSNRF